MSKLKTRTNQPIIGDTIDGNLTVNGTITGSEVIQPLSGIEFLPEHWESAKGLSDSLQLTVNFFKITNINNVIHLSYGITAQGLATYTTTKGEFITNMGRIILSKDIINKIWSQDITSTAIIAVDGLNGYRGSGFIDYNLICDYMIAYDKNNDIYYLFYQMRSGNAFTISSSFTANYRGELTLLLSDNLIQ